MDYLFHLVFVAGYWAVAAIGLNLILGYTGLLSVTHAAFIGIGAYSVAILTTAFGLHAFWGLLLGMVLAALIALLIGLVLSRFRGDYYMLVTLGFNVVVYGLFLNLEGLTGGPLGIASIPRPTLFGLVIRPGFSYFLVLVAALLLVYAVARFVTNSSLGRVLAAIREDEEAISVFGYPVAKYKLFIFVVGAVLAAFIGAVVAPYVTYIDPNNYGINESIAIFIIAIFGGLGSLRGSIVGAVVLALVPEMLRFVGFPSSIAGDMRQLIYGLVLVLVMLYRPQGLFGKFKF
jgi:branched-chain amino acid transport system permease protein